jgi:hypothetical protein
MLAETNEEFAKAYFFRASVYFMRGNKADAKQVTDDFKKAADYGHKEALSFLKDHGVDYTPQKPSSSSAPNSGGSSARSPESDVKIKCPHCGFVKETKYFFAKNEATLFHGNLFCSKCHELFKFE